MLPAISSALIPGWKRLPTQPLGRRNQLSGGAASGSAAQGGYGEGHLRVVVVGMVNGGDEQAGDVSVPDGVEDEGSFAPRGDQTGQAQFGQVLTDSSR